jgi:hypothetical protein
MRSGVRRRQHDGHGTPRETAHVRVSLAGGDRSPSGAYWCACSSLELQPQGARCLNRFARVGCVNSVRAPKTGDMQAGPSFCSPQGVPSQ